MKTIFALFLLAGPAFADNCKISSQHYPELATGANRETLCASVERALTESGHATIDNLELTVTSWPSYGPTMNFRFNDESRTFTGSGLEYWNPDQAVFVIQP